MYTSQGNGEKAEFLSAVKESWVGLGMLALFALAALAVPSFHHMAEIFAGTFLVLALVLGMNGLARTDLVFGRQEPQWVQHRTWRWVHGLQGEGELAGIGMALFATAWWYSVSGHKFEIDHVGFGMGATLFGIMSGASRILPEVTRLLQRLEGYIGNYWSIVTGSMFASVVGEPAAASVVSAHLKDRTSGPEGNYRTATALAATIGSGGALLPFAAPPILIVWGRLTDHGWTMLTLLLFVGLPALLHVMVSARVASRYTVPLVSSKTDDVNYVQVAGFLVLVLAHLVTPMAYMPLVYFADMSVGLFNILEKWVEKVDQGERIDGHNFGEIFQPLVLSVLLIALEMAGHVAEPSIEFYGTKIAEGVIWTTDLMQVPGAAPLVLALGLFLVGAFVSAFADNALASTVLVTIPLTGAMPGGATYQDLLITAVLMGCLFGGILLPPSNLPNFVLKRVFNVKDSEEWLRGSVPLLRTGVAYVAAIFVIFFVLS